MDAQQTIPASRYARDTAGAAITADAVGRLALDDVVLADIGYRQDNTATADIAGHRVVPLALRPAGITVTAHPLRGRGFSWEGLWGTRRSPPARPA